MEIMGLVFLFVVLAGGYSFVQRQREREREKRLEKHRDPTLAGLEVDAVIAQSRREANALRWMRDHNRL